MNAPPDRRVLAIVGGGVLLLVAILIGAFFARSHGHSGKAAADSGRLQIEQGLADSRAAASTKELRCFVDGKFSGMASIADCAAKNGVAAQALDVGLDPATGEVTAASGTLAPALKPLPPAPTTAEPAQSDARAEPAASPAASAGPPGDCLRYTPDGWRSAGAGVGLGQCVRVLFDGRCERPGEALYGRWGGQTVRLVPGRVEISPDNRNFRILAPQNSQDCSLPAG